jgi:hypothetical protein
MTTSTATPGGALLRVSRIVVSLLSQVAPLYTPMPCRSRHQCQVMSSGMTTSTATPGRACEGYLLDPAGLRDHPECDIVLEPNFGLLIIDWGDDGDDGGGGGGSSGDGGGDTSGGGVGGGGVRSISLQVRDARGSVRLQSVLTPGQC